MHDKMHNTRQSRKSYSERANVVPNKRVMYPFLSVGEKVNLEYAYRGAMPVTSEEAIKRFSARMSVVAIPNCEGKTCLT